MFDDAHGPQSAIDYLDGLRAQLIADHNLIRHLKQSNQELRARLAILESWHARFASKNATPAEVAQLADEWWKSENVRLEAAGIPLSGGCQESEHNDVLFWSRDRKHLDRMMCLWCGRIRRCTEEELGKTAQQEERDRQRREEFARLCGPPAYAAQQAIRLACDPDGKHCVKCGGPTFGRLCAKCQGECP